MSDQLNDAPIPVEQSENVESQGLGLRDRIVLAGVVGVATAAFVAGNVLMASGDDARQEIDEEQADGKITAEEANRRLAGLEAS